ncbi:MAG TPA: hypothetical protein VNJ07_12310, partial [Chitinophagales bacterium]|nr:hypothetical protein [Chitinophagales bacterium]
QRHPRVFLFSFVTLLLLIPCFFEFVIWQFLYHPEFNNDFPYLHPAVADIYYRHELEMVQYQPRCADYDSVLFYAMKPGVCRHRSIEFNCTYSFNSAGLRDDDASLDKPEIIVLGDSYAMGWGMSNEKIFSSLIEQQTGMKTLNAAVPSYGTAREFLFLERLDLSNLKYLVIQYCANDFEENKQFVEQGFRLQVNTREVYQGIVRNHVNRIKYYPLLYVSTLARVTWARIFGKSEEKKSSKLVSKAAINFPQVQNLLDAKPATSASAEDSAVYFLDIVRSKPALENVQIIVMNISGPLYTTPSFINALSKVKESSSYPAFVRSIKPVDICGIVGKQDYFTLDCHLNEQGHRKVAALVTAAIHSE